MTWFARRTTVQIRFALNGKTLFAHVPPAVADYCDAMAEGVGQLTAENIELRQRQDQRVAELNAENDALVASARVMANAQQARIDGQADIIAGLNKALAVKQGELDRALAEVKRLDAKLVQVEAENMQVHGELATAREEIAGYRLAVGS